jgi:hypothetical protein
MSKPNAPFLHRSTWRSFRITYSIVGNSISLIKLDETTVIQLALQLLTSTLNTRFHP